MRLLLALIVVLGCRGPKLAELEKPAYIWMQEQGLCGRSVAMDRRGVLWTEAGCENPNTRYRKRRVLPEAERKLVIATFATLDKSEPASRSTCRVLHRFIVMKPGGQYAEWRACGQRLDDPTSGAAEPYATAIRRLPLR